jgi:hypothetical protein
MPAVTMVPVRIDGRWVPQLVFLTRQHLWQLCLFAKTSAKRAAGLKWLNQQIQWPQFLNDREIGVEILIFRFCVFCTKPVRRRRRPKIKLPIDSAISISYQWRIRCRNLNTSYCSVYLQKHPLPEMTSSIATAISISYQLLIYTICIVNCFEVKRLFRCERHGRYKLMRFGYLKMSDRKWCHKSNPRNLSLISGSCVVLLYL